MFQVVLPLAPSFLCPRLPFHIIDSCREYSLLFCVCVCVFFLSPDKSKIHLVMRLLIRPPHHACDRLLARTPLLATTCTPVGGQQDCSPMFVRAEALLCHSFPALQVPHGHSLEGSCNEDILAFVEGDIFKTLWPFNNTNCLFKAEETVPFSHGDIWVFPTLLKQLASRVEAAIHSECVHWSWLPAIDFSRQVWNPLPTTCCAMGALWSQQAAELSLISLRSKFVLQEQTRRHSQSPLGL